MLLFIVVIQTIDTMKAFCTSGCLTAAQVTDRDCNAMPSVTLKTFHVILMAAAAFVEALSPQFFLKSLKGALFHRL